MTGITVARAWRRGALQSIAAVALAVGLVCGSTATAHADILDDLAEQYAIGASGGQLSKLLKVSLKLRSMGYKPSQTYLDGLTKAATYRPNQNPLIEAMKDTIAYQAKAKAQTDLIRGSQSQQGVVSTGQMPVGSQIGTSAPGGQSGALQTAGFSGAEIEQAVIAAMYEASSTQATLNTEHIVAEVARTRPLSVVMAEKIAYLRAWAQDRTVRADE